MTRTGANDWQWVRPRVDVAALPVEVNLSPSRIVAVFGLIFGGIWFSISLPLVTGIGPANVGIFAFAMIFPLIGATFMLASLLAFFRRRRVTFGHDGVEVVGRSLFGRESWSARYDDFQGVLYRTRTVNRKNGSTTYQIIELRHHEPDRSLPVYVATTTTPPRGEWENYARAFGLPALEDTGAGLLARAVDDLDKSLKELAEEGKLEAPSFDSTSPPPKGLIAGATTVDGVEALRVVVTAGRIPAWLGLAFGGIPATMVVIALVELGPDALVMLLFAFGFLAIVGWMFYYDRRQKREMIITREHLKVVDGWNMTQSVAPITELALADIEGVSVRRARSNLGGELVIAGDKGQIVFGMGLSKAALDWLRDYITAAIATA